MKRLIATFCAVMLTFAAPAMAGDEKASKS